MRIDRVRLKDFGGVAEAEVRFAPVGVTVVHGPNEAGKSTLMQALTLLFDFPDDSRREEVRATQPVDRGVGSEVEADIVVGDIRFTYFKRFHRNRETRLTLHAPAPANLAGREAHDRVRQILEASVDTALWRALRIVQGGALELPELRDQPALTRALDRVAGQAKAGAREDTLVEAARAEFLRYFTETGRDREDPLGQARRAVEEAEARELDLRARLLQLEQDMEQVTELERSLLSLEGALPALENSCARARAAQAEVVRLGEEAADAGTRENLAAQARDSMRQDVREREALVAAAAAAHRRVEGCAASSVQADSALVASAEALEAVRLAREQAERVALRSETEARGRREDHDFLRDEQDRQAMVDRLERVRQADAAAAEAEARVAASRITEARREAIRSAEVALKTALGVLNTAAPRFTLEAVQMLTVRIEGQVSVLEAGRRQVFPVGKAITADLGDFARITVEPGTSSDALRREVEDAERALSRACAEAGVGDPDAAEAAWSALLDAKRAVADRDRVVREVLRDVTREALASRIADSEARAGAFRARRDADVPWPPDVQSAEERMEQAERDAAEAQRALKLSGEAMERARERHGACREAFAASAALHDQAIRDHALAAGRLATAREIRTDEALAIAFAEAQARASAAGDVHASRRAALAKADPDSVQAFAKAAADALEAGRGQVEVRARELIGLRARLEVLGDHGLAEGLAQAERTAFEARDALERLARRAAAARLLHETLQAEREAMRRAYVVPLQAGIERLGRHVFGPTLRVTVDEELRVVSRTVDGVTVNLAQLSTGAREQMGLLVRLAVAAMVSGDGGVPLVVDDALGATDQARLEAMGAVLRVASRDSQTIILTCAPERYLYAGPGAVVALARRPTAP